MHIRSGCFLILNSVSLGRLSSWVLSSACLEPPYNMVRLISGSPLFVLLPVDAVEMFGLY